MEELLNLATKDPKLIKEVIFLKHQYPEIKDLLKHFLTLISASLVFSVTFSEKIINFSTASATRKNLLLASWITLILALGSCGYALYSNYTASEIAMMHLAGVRKDSFEQEAQRSFLFEDLSAFLFGIGMFHLVLTAYIGDSLNANPQASSADIKCNGS